MKVLSEDEVIYSVEPMQNTPEALRFIYEVFQKHDILLSDPFRKDVDAFLEYMFSPDVIIYSVTDDKDKVVGILYADLIVPMFSARGHYLFWDLRTKGRQRLILSVMKEFMEAFDLERMVFRVPVYAYAALNRLRHMGAWIEGRTRHTVLRHGKWEDELVFSFLREELTEEAVWAGTVDSEKSRGLWMKLLDNEPKLDEYILRKER